MSTPSSSQGSEGPKSQSSGSKDAANESFGTPPANFNFWAIRPKSEGGLPAKKLKLTEDEDEQAVGISGLDVNKKYPLDLIIVGRRAISLTRDPSRYFWKFTGRDEAGKEMSILVFEAARFDDCNKMMQMEDTVRISNYSLDTVSQKGENYEPSKFQIRLHSKSVIESSSVVICSPFRDFVKIKDIKCLEEGKLTDMLGVLVYISGVQQYESKCKRVIVLTDEFDQNIQIHLWNQEAIQFVGEIGDPVAVLKGGVKSHGGVVVLTTTANTTIWVKPEKEKLADVKGLLEWFEAAKLKKKEAEENAE